MIDDIKKLCRAYGITPQRSKGQHFLLDQSMIDKMVQVAALGRNDTVIEIGPGLGILTEALVAAAGRVVSVELDRKLFALLQAKFVAAANLELVNADILRCSLGDLAHGVDYKIIANIPYNITSRFIKNLLTAAAKPSIAVLLVQKEVAQRVCAKPGDLSLLGLSSQLYSRPEIIATVGRDQFWPAPAVDSAILVLRDIKPAAAMSSNRYPKSSSGRWHASVFRPGAKS